MILPEYLITDFATDRYQRLSAPLSGVYVRELVRFTDNVADFLKMFPEKDHFIATLFFEQQVNPMVKVYVEAKKILVAYTANTNLIINSRNALGIFCANATTDYLLTQIKNIENLEINQEKQQNNFYCACAILYPIHTLTNLTTINNNIQHIT